jgi:hypothetical protein
MLGAKVLLGSLGQDMYYGQCPETSFSNTKISLSLHCALIHPALNKYFSNVKMVSFMLCIKSATASVSQYTVETVRSKYT